MSRNLKALWVGLGLVVVAAVFGFKIHAELVRGEQIVWLAVLWPPAAVLSIGLVTCLEFLVPQDPASKPPAKGRAKTR